MKKFKIEYQDGDIEGCKVYEGNSYVDAYDTFAAEHPNGFVRKWTEQLSNLDQQMHDIMRRRDELLGQLAELEVEERKLADVEGERQKIYVLHHTPKFYADNCLGVISAMH